MTDDNVPVIKSYITFGQVHAHSVNGKTFDKDCVAVINGGRDLAFELFGDKWCFHYTKFSDIDMSYFPRGLIEVSDA